MRDAVHAVLLAASVAGCITAMLVFVGRQDAENDASYARYATCRTILACRGNR